MGNSPGTGGFPAQMASNAENVSIWWRHHSKFYNHDGYQRQMNTTCGNFVYFKHVTKQQSFSFVSNYTDGFSLQMIYNIFSKSIIIKYCFAMHLKTWPMSTESSSYPAHWIPWAKSDIFTNMCGIMKKWKTFGSVMTNAMVPLQRLYQFRINHTALKLFSEIVWTEDSTISRCLTLITLRIWCPSIEFSGKDQTNDQTILKVSQQDNILPKLLPLNPNER